MFTNYVATFSKYFAIFSFLAVFNGMQVAVGPPFPGMAPPVRAAEFAHAVLALETGGPGRARAAPKRPPPGPGSDPAYAPPCTTAGGTCPPSWHGQPATTLLELPEQGGGALPAPGVLP